MRRPLRGFGILIIHSFLVCAIRIATAEDRITAGESIRDGETVVSAAESFELGFFSPENSNSRYLGIWYKKVSPGTVAWVANRDAPLSDHSGVLSISLQGVLVLLNRTNDTIWSSNASRTASNPVAVLLDSGNLVVKDGSDDNNPDNFLWQSFDYPCNTLLPGMKLGINLDTGLNRFLSSWKSLDDAAEGDFTFKIDPDGYPQSYLRKGSDIQFRSGSWNGLRWTGAPTLKPNSVYTYEFVLNEHEVYFKFEILNDSVPSRMVLSPSGQLQRFTWIDRTRRWAPYSATISDQCDNYDLCGAYASCNINNPPTVCGCLDGFSPKSPGDWNIFDWSDGCVPRTPLNCSESGDGFLKLSAVKLPDTSHSKADKNFSLLECEKLCFDNCSCTAYANLDVRDGGSGCLLWFDDLIDIRDYTDIDGGQDLYVRMAASELDKIRKRRKSSKKKHVVIIVTSVIAAMGAWRLWIEERAMELIDGSLDEACPLPEILRCIHVGLLCVQQAPEDRPIMASVVLMLGGERSLPQPKQPGFFTERNLPESSESSSSKQRFSSNNEITFSLLEAR
ncbi:hypothetical protein Pint_04369 [Pistacia integerrima]|uniref:Uncharacterized protein n=1 Tax=Pistacia integerrima TaxID=434235 RepID=A0ACC0Z3N5_9ROSI|nr:hypothetical protein Pint_04369 [Pistacia integerrima]